jgi:hypothetical protein
MQTGRYKIGLWGLLLVATIVHSNIRAVCAKTTGFGGKERRFYQLTQYDIIDKIEGGAHNGPASSGFDSLLHKSFNRVDSVRAWKPNGATEYPSPDQGGI